MKIKKAFARMMTSIPTKAKPNELVAFSQPPFCNGGKHCGRDKSGLWHCTCISQNKSKR